VRSLLALPFVLLALVPAVGSLPVPPVGETSCLTGEPTGQVLFEDGFDSGASAWTLVSAPGVQDLWHWTTFAGNGSAHDGEGHGSPGRVYYGIENAQGGTYNTQPAPNQGELRGPSVLIPTGAVALRLHTKWHVEWDRAWYVDSMNVGVVEANGVRHYLCWLGNTYAGVSNLAIGYGYYQNSPTGQAVPTGCAHSTETFWQPCTLYETATGDSIYFDLAPDLTRWESRYVMLPPTLAGKSVRPFLYFQTGDAIVDDAMGWMADDVALVRIA
jgi:hypothetical protein